MKRLVFLALLTATSALAQTLPGAKDIPKHGPAIALFDGANLDAWETYWNPAAAGEYRRSKGTNVVLDDGPNDGVSIDDGLLHISGKRFGFLVTKKPFDHYYLQAEFKWGENMYAPRIGTARDSGLHFNVQPPMKLWPQDLEFQICECGTGDLYLSSDAAITTPDGLRHESKFQKIPRIGEGPVQDKTGFRDPVGEVENPFGEWNLLELVNSGNHIRMYVNGKLVNEGSDPTPSSGRILLQSEGSEVFFRNIRLFPLN